MWEIYIKKQNPKSNSHKNYSLIYKKIRIWDIFIKCIKLAKFIYFKDMIHIFKKRKYMYIFKYFQEKILHVGIFTKFEC